MAVTRISRDALDNVLRGDIKENSTFVLKFYSNNCHLCHNLREYFVDVSNKEEYEDCTSLRTTLMTILNWKRN